MSSSQAIDRIKEFTPSTHIQLKSSHVLRQSLREVPAIQPLARSILQELDESEADFESVQRVIKHDPSLCANIIRCATALMSGEDQKPSLSHAIKWLGLRRVRHIVLFHVSQNHFTSPEPAGFDREQLWTYCHAVACFGKLIAEEKNYSREREDRIFSAGLLHALGIAWINEYLPEMFTDIVREVNFEQKDIANLERKYIGITHGEVGERIYRKWDLDDAIIQATCFYTSPFETDELIPKVVHLASALARSSGYTRGIDHDSVYVDGRVPSTLGLSNRDVLKLLRTEYPRRFKEDVHSLSSQS